MGEFLSMGGYGAFVWPAYAISIGVLAALAIWTIAAQRNARRRLDDFESRK